MAIKQAKSDKIFDICNKILVWFFIVVISYPLVYIISASISDPQYVNSGEMWLFPKGLTFEGFERVFQSSEIWLGYRNTIFYTLLGTFINLAVTLPMAYALSRSDLVGRKFIMLALVFTMFFEGGLIPTYLLVRDLGMINTVWAMVLPSAAAMWNIIVTMTFFKVSIPKGLEEAAEIDGASQIRTFFQIVIPLSAPIIAVMALFYGVGHWNQYFGALIYLQDRELYPLQLFLREILVQQQLTTELMQQSGSAEALSEHARIADIIKYAVMIVSAAPLLIVYPFLQRFFIKGVMIGSLKE
ncbi:carbohydrate ABC transporter permease [Ornithinibacillus halophilus]|uniref:Carbohydrate ABC transporter membrane protein 2, CUT1 family n=1 Tax=Ornithinibacillus halophilus TaxID=930117 RepID=A0A1M5K2M7_9BACI|nr:carbohydrate ABC transporter permease [Ornithinibacillus halophilus]SHG47027.1 carbohydrate ABC transporter membrane protein 2, CUT1 family [Ornithinibacillus halophilus]